MQFGEAARQHFCLDPQGTFLNHGSYGAALRASLDEQQRLSRRLEAHTTWFQGWERPTLLEAARARLARYLRADPADLVFVDNATTAANAVLGSIQLGPADEVVHTSLGYGAVRHVLRHLAKRTGCRLVEADIPFPLEGPEVVVERVRACLSDHTRLLVVDHITSSTGLVLPVEPLIALCHERGIRVFVDGAHSVGQIPLDLGALGADWYTSNAHKWLCTTKGCAFLHATPAARVGLHSPVLSHGYQQGFHNEFDFIATRDYSHWLALPAALDVREAAGDARWREHNHALVREAGPLVAAILGSRVATPVAMTGSLLSIPLSATGTWTDERWLALQRALWEQHRIESMPTRIGELGLLRLSAQVYNHLPEYERLAVAVRDLLAAGA